jgi:hypothetical protein
LTFSMIAAKSLASSVCDSVLGFFKKDQSSQPGRLADLLYHSSLPPKQPPVMRTASKRRSFGHCQPLSVPSA